jgi:nucleoside-diphosphate-sugar epimerase
VTGGLGFIGSSLCHTLLDEGFEVRCVDDLSGTYAPGAAAAPAGSGELQAPAGTGPAAAAALASRGADVRIAGARPSHLRGVDAAIHLAALPGVRTRRPAAAIHAANVELPARLARAAARRGARFVLASSSSVYGNAERLPTPEDAPPSLLGSYAASKVAAEAAVLAAGGDPVIVRPFTVYGPGQRPEMAVARWIAALDSGDPLPWRAAPGTARDFTYVDDAVAGLIAALIRGRSGEAYNVSGRRSVLLRRVLDLVAPDAELRELPPSPADALVTAGCGRKAEAELGYSPRVDLADGLARQRAVASSPSLAA